MRSVGIKDFSFHDGMHSRASRSKAVLALRKSLHFLNI